MVVSPPTASVPREAAPPPKTEVVEKAPAPETIMSAATASPLSRRRWGGFVWCWWLGWDDEKIGAWKGMKRKSECFYIQFLEVMQCSGQIIATSHDLTPNGGLVREIPLFQENLGW